MSVTTDSTQEITIGKLHELSPDEFSNIYIEIHRRNEPGAGMYGNACFLTPDDTDICVFHSTENALAFIDDIHANGVIATVAKRVGGDPSVSDILPHLHVSCREKDAIELFERSGLNDPLKLSITVYTETQHTTRAASSSVATELEN